ncbi:MAG TPA: aspartate aminotransferase family protein [Planctomycetaceae bacterium]|nr:aspartate aminotransferase family protein [Planctomycetaceae bacterium]
MPTYDKSKELYERACRVLSGGVASEFRKFSTPHPLFYAKGEGSRLWDVDGNEYLDFTLSQGPLVLGHSHPEILHAVTEASQAGQLYAGQHLQELELAELLQRLIPCAERLRFSLSGSEADHAALRLARAVTGRPRFLRFEGHYHGWFDSVAWGVGGTLPDMGPREEPTAVPWSQGLPSEIRDEFLTLPWNDLGLVEQLFARHASELAAVITEPVMCNNGCIPPQPGFLQGLRELCTRHGVLLIFDEVITGFRTSLGGAQQLLGITPDLAVFGKAMASGYPISILAGKEQHMRLIAEGKVIHAGTMNSGNPCVAAALKTVQILERDQIPARLKELGEHLMAGLADASRRAGKPLLVQGLGPMFHAGFTPQATVRDYRETLSYDKPAYARFVAGMHSRGIRLIGRGLWYVSAAHTPADLDRAISTAYEVLCG